MDKVYSVKHAYFIMQLQHAWIPCTKYPIAKLAVVIAGADLAKRKGVGQEKMKPEKHLIVARFALSMEECCHRNRSRGNSLRFKL